MIVNLQQKSAQEDAAEMQTRAQNRLYYPRFQAFWMGNVVTVATAFLRISFRPPSVLQRASAASLHLCA